MKHAAVNGLRLAEQGVDEGEVARRFRHSPEMIRRTGQRAGLARPEGPLPEAMCSAHWSGALNIWPNYKLGRV